MSAITALQRVWDGSEWVKVKGDSSGRVVVQPRRCVCVFRHTWWSTTELTAGTTLTVIDQPNIGPGRIHAMRVYVDGGDWGSAQGILIKLTIDNVVAMSQSWEVIFNTVFNLGTHRGVYTTVITADSTNSIFDGEMILNAEFTQGFKLEVQNRSTTTNTTRCAVNLYWGYYQEI